MPRDERRRWEQSTHTRAVVSFFTDEVGGFEAVEPIQSHPDFGHIIAVSTEKTLGNAAGSFSITVKSPPSPRGRGQTQHNARSWKRLWRDPEQVWVWIRFIVDGETIDGMFGQIDTVNESTSRGGGGERSETFTISGRDFGKVFETTEMFTNFYAAEALTQGVMSQAALIRTALENITGTPAHFVRFLVETWLGNNGIGEAQWLLPRSLGGDVFASALHLGTIQRMDSFTNGLLHNPNIMSVDSQQGSKLWDTMQELSNGLLNEMWVDLAPPTVPPIPYLGYTAASVLSASYGIISTERPSSGTDAAPLTGLVPSLYLRERPFPTRSSRSLQTNRAKWDQLRRRRLRPEDVQQRSLARGGASQRYNYWQLDAVGLGSQDYGNVNLLQRGIEGVAAGRPGNNPIFNGQSMARHGVRRYFQSTRFLPIRETDAEVETWTRVAARWLQKLHDWYSIAQLELSGSLTTTRIMPEIRIGERIDEERSEGTISYYCEGVSNEWEYPNAGRSTLTLTRGEYEDEHLLDYIYDQYETPDVRSAQEACFVPELQLLTGEDQSPELIDALARGCTFRAPTINVGGGDPTSTGLGEITDGDDAITREHRTLTAERDGTIPTPVDPDAPAVQDPGMNPALDDTDAAIDDGALPAPDAVTEDPGDPALTQEQLERGEPIETSDDPLYPDAIDAGF